MGVHFYGTVQSGCSSAYRKHDYGHGGFTGGASLNSVVDVESDYRFLVCESYLAFYRIEGSGIYIDRVLHETQDYMRVLFGKK